MSVVITGAGFYFDTCTAAGHVHLELPAGKTKMDIKLEDHEAARVHDLLVDIYNMRAEKIANVISTNPAVNIPTLAAPESQPSDLDDDFPI